MSMLSSRFKVLQSFVSRHVWFITIATTTIIIIIIIIIIVIIIIRASARRYLF